MSDVLVRGVGLLGTSLGLALSQTGMHATLEDLDPDAVRTAVGMGAGNQGPCPNPEIVFVAVPPDQIVAEVAAALVRFPEATITDVGSVKSEPIDALVNAGVDLSRYVGGHPMAGREVSGAAAGRGDLFEDRPWILTPIPQTDPVRLARISEVAASLRAVVRLMDPEEHDRAVALCSHAPQVVASLLAAQLLGASAADVSVAGPGLRDTTRIAASDPELWAQILLANAEHVEVHISRFAEDVDAFSKALVGRDSEGVKALLSRGVQGRAMLPGKHGGEAADAVTVSVVIEDAPGQLAALFQRAGEADVNLEDVRIEHTLGRLRAIAHLVVQPDSEQRLRESLTLGGWRLRG
ncbi:MAG: prephenate dehydrogenase [Candidatus Nanopelagicales bacterium]|jgi:prephenate dehydrogenase|nr:prephenate dehydrogenase [Candidatus Nanopelagicales bacterium]